MLGSAPDEADPDLDSIQLVRVKPSDVPFWTTFLGLAVKSEDIIYSYFSLAYQSNSLSLEQAIMRVKDQNFNIDYDLYYHFGDVN